MKSDFTYHMPVKIVSGVGTFDDIDRYVNGRKTLLITSPGAIARGLVDRLNALTDNIVEVISEVKSHPEFSDLEIVYNKINKIEFDLILAIGGGSVLDAAKFFSVQNSAKEYRFVEGVIRGQIPPENYNLIPIISIPTTAGTGSEITPWATLWDLDEKKKYSLHLPELFSEVAVYDPALTLSVPREITIQTGLDTLSHALESIWNKNANPITIGYAIKSAKLVMKHLPLLVDDLQNIEQREKIMLACMYAGLAFSNTQTAIAHGMSYYITAHKGVDHGIACSFTLPLLIDNVIGKYAFIDEALLEIFGELSSRKLRDLFDGLDVSVNFSDYGIGADDLEIIASSLRGNKRAGNSLVAMA